MTLDLLQLYFLVGVLIAPTLMVWRMGLDDDPPMWEVLLAGALFVPVWPVVTLIATLVTVRETYLRIKDLLK